MPQSFSLNRIYRKQRDIVVERRAAEMEKNRRPPKKGKTNETGETQPIATFPQTTPSRPDKILVVTIDLRLVQSDEDRVVNDQYLFYLYNKPGLELEIVRSEDNMTIYIFAKEKFKYDDLDLGIHPLGRPKEKLIARPDDTVVGQFYGNDTRVVRYNGQNLVFQKIC